MAEETVQEKQARLEAEAIDLCQSKLEGLISQAKAGKFHKNNPLLHLEETVKLAHRVRSLLGKGVAL